MARAAEARAAAVARAAAAAEARAADDRAAVEARAADDRAAEEARQEARGHQRLIVDIAVYQLRGPDPDAEGMDIDEIPEVAFWRIDGGQVQIKLPDNSVWRLAG